jgi:pyruvate/2-oxoglutarate dehydrogenase complex dihydrolipoamide acyltransferase (E2) component
MGALIDIKVPDIGDFTDVEVIEVMVKPGDPVRVDDSLITIESDKASMEVPATEAGIVKEIRVKVGDKVSEGSPIVVIEAAPAADGKAAAAAAPAPSSSKNPHRQPLNRRSRQSRPPPPKKRRRIPRALRLHQTRLIRPSRLHPTSPIRSNSRRLNRPLSLRPSLNASRTRARPCGNSRVSSGLICTPSTAAD